jgi:hypothetical protein
MKGRKMHTDQPGNSSGNSLENAKGATIVAYNVRKEERPDGLKVRWKWRIETGRKAAAIDARQAEVLREALTWLRQHPSRT